MSGGQLIHAACNPSGYGEGERFFASLTVTTDDTGNAAFTLAVPIAVDVGSFISATATDPSGNTSEFAACVAVEGPGKVGVIAVPLCAICPEAPFAVRVGFQTPSGGQSSGLRQSVANSLFEPQTAEPSSGLDVVASGKSQPDSCSPAFPVDDFFSQALGADLALVLMTAF